MVEKGVVTLPYITYHMEYGSTIEKVEIDRYPDFCPSCKRGISPNFQYGFLSGEIIQVAFTCPMNYCKRMFVGNYAAGRGRIFLFLSTHLQEEYKTVNFDDKINNLSPEFVVIYNQAYKAEQIGLSEICGIAYRKSIEFLVKDYLIFNSPEDEVSIIKKPLGACIDQNIDNPRIKSMAKRAVWLGNDETHYSRKHEMMGIEDLKTLIDITQHWILVELLSKEYETRLP